MKLIFPCNFIGLTQEYKSSHKAIDMGWSTSNGGPNHEILSPYAGKVTYVKNDHVGTDINSSSYGNYVKIDHGNGYTTLHAHLVYQSVVVKVGDTVEEGQKIGLMGTTGRSTGVHLHYEVRINDEKVNPLLHTYAKEGQVVSSNTQSKYNILYLPKEEVAVDVEEPENSGEVVVDDTIFEYVVPKTGMYKIQLNENEKLVIKD